MDNVMIKNALDMCELIRNVLRGEGTDTTGMDYAELHKLAKRQTLTAITYMALELSGAVDDLNPELNIQWKTQKDKAIRKNLLLSAGRIEIFAELEKAGIWYMPLKGSILAEMYPKLGMRQMADNDILFDKRYRDEVKCIMKELGYNVELYNHSNHDVYHKAPIYNYEMHTDLFSVGIDHVKNYAVYYGDVENMLLSDGGLRRKFKPEDFYVYFLAHGFKHFYGNGNGVRFLVDCHVFLAQQKRMDWNYIAQELKKLELYEFDQTIRSLTKKLFGDVAELTVEEKETLLFCLSSNTYGSTENGFRNALRKVQPKGKITTATRLKYLWRRIWPSKEWFESFHPFLAKYWVIKPLFIIWRMFRGVFTRGRHLVLELKYVLNKK